MTAGEARLAGLALAGGRSRRFGADKAVARLAGRPLLAWTLATLDEACAAVAVSAAAGGEAAALAASLGRPVLLDDPGHAAGPLAGVAAGLAWAAANGFEALVTLPCDAPLVGAAELAALIAALGEGPAAYAVSSDGPQPLCAVWRPRLAGDLAARLAGGRHPAVQDFLGDIGARPVPFADPRPFANVNRREDLARLAARLAET
jgi:molybdenum cofactor guanylyltransferase